MRLLNVALDHTTALHTLDPNKKWVYGAVCPRTLTTESVPRLVYIGETCQPLTGRSANNRAECFKSTPWLSYYRSLAAEGLRPIVKYLPFPSEAGAIEHVGFENLLNESPAGGGRKPSVVWQTEHVDAVLGERTLVGLSEELGVGTHHLRRLRQRYRQVQVADNWFDLDELRWWPIDDLHLMH